MNSICTPLAHIRILRDQHLASYLSRMLVLVFVAFALSTQSATAQVCDDLGTFDIDFNDPTVNPLRAPTPLNAIQSGGQVFVAPCTGKINSISFYVSNGGSPSFPIEGRLKFWADQYLNPFTLLASVPVSIPAIGPRTVDLPGGVFVTAGQEYSFMVDPSSGSGTFEGSNDNNFILNSNRFFGNATTGDLEGVAGDANHAINFGPAEYDQCTASDDIDITSEVNSFANLISSQGVGQVLTAPCHGTMDSFTVVADGSVFPIEGTVRVFFGNGGLGKEIASTAYSIPGNGTYTVTLPSIGVAGGEVYTVFFDAPTSGVGNLYGVGGADVYGQGNWVVGPDPANMVGLGFDLGFGITFGDFCIGVCEQFVALTELYKSTNGDNWADNTNWFAGSVPSDWFGVSGPDQEVGDINLSNNNLTGTLTDDIGGLGFLSGGINLSGNSIGGTIPAGLANITTGFEALDLTGNNFTGGIPDLSPVAASLRELKLGDNNLSGSIPSNIDNLIQLRVLELYDNNFTGPIPPEVGNLTNLTSLELGGNSLSGAIPTTISNLTALTTLNLRDAGLNGIIPLSIRFLTNLEILQLSSNAFTGPVPDVSDMSGLIILSLDNNQLTGSVPTLDGVDLPVLSEINLSSNNLTGAIPSSTYNLPSLNFLGLSSNQLTGSIPELTGVFNLTLTELGLADNQLTGTVPASLLCTVNIRNVDLSANQLSGVVPDNGTTCGESWDELESLELVDFSNNQFVGTVPPTLQSSNSVQTLLLSSNEFDAVPDLSFVTSLIALDISSNRLDFDDITPNVGITGITYAPQKTFGTAGNVPVTIGSSVELAFPSVGGAANTYEWQKDGFPVVGSDYVSYSVGFVDGDAGGTFVGAQASDAGDYQLQVTDTAVPGLTLESELLSVEVNAAFTAPDGYVFTEFATGLTQPQGLAFDNQDNTLVAVTGSGEVRRYLPDGSPADSGDPLIFNTGRVIDLEILGDFLFISDLDANAIYRVSLSALTANSDIATLQPTPWLSGLNGATYMKIGPDGLLYFSEVREPATDKIRRVDPNAASPTPTTVIEFAPATAELPQGLNPQSMEFDRNGDFYFTTQFGGDVRRIKNLAAATLPVDPSNATIVFTGLSSPGGLDIGVDGKIYVTDQTTVYSASVGSAVLAPFITGLNGYEFNNAEFDPKGRLYVADGNAGTLYLAAAPVRQVQPTGSITYQINADGNPRTTDGSDFTAIRNAFAHWESVPTAAVTAVDGGLTPVSKADATDGVNVVTFRDDDFPFAPFVLAVAAKLIEFSTADEANIVDADIVFNPAFIDDGTFNFGTDTQLGFFDIESIATHEVGHTLGMIHSGNPSSTMFFALPPGTEARTLELDDRAWIGYRYPDASFAALGSIAGSIIDGEDLGQPVAGALVLAKNDATGETVHAYSDLNGDYLVPGLPAGSYTISIQPLDGSVSGFELQAAAISVNLATITQNTSFQEEFFNGPNESDDPATDDPSDATLISVSGSPVTGIDLTTNRDVTPPSILAFDPADGDVDADVNTDVLITFSESINASTLALEVRDVATATPVGGTLQLENNKTLAIITLQNTLLPSTDYEVIVAAGLEDERGNATVDAVTIAFTTQAPDTSTPTVQNVSPAPGAINVNTRDAVTVAFSKSMDPATINVSSFAVSSPAGPIGGVVSVDRSLNNTAARFVPNLPLDEATTYTVTLAAGIADVSGNTLAAPFVSTFNTVPAAAPEIVSVGPSGGQTALDVETSVVVDFTEAIDRNTVTSATFAVTGPSGVVAGGFAFLLSDSRVVFTPNEPLAFGATYTIDLGTGIADISSTVQNLAAPFSSTFTTATAPVNPTIVSVSPPSATKGTVVVIAGSGFDPVPTNNIVSFNGTVAPVIKSTLSTISVKVPATATTGPLTVTAGGNQSNSFAFSVVTNAISTEEAVGIVAAEGGARDTDTTPDGTFAYVTNSDANSVSVIDLTTLTSLLPITVGQVPFKIAINPTGTKAYVTNFVSNTVSVIDIATNTVTATIPVGLNPTGVTVSPDGSKIYVAEYTSKGISIIEGDPERGGFNAVTGRIATESGNSDVESSPDGTILFVTGTSGLAIVDINPASPKFNQVVARVAAETQTTDVDTTPDGTFALVTTINGEVLLIDIRPNASDPYKVVAKTSSEAGAEGVESGPDGTKFFVTNSKAGTVDVYKIEIGLAGEANGVLASAGESHDPIISSGFKLRQVDSIPVGTEPEGLVFAPAVNLVVVANSGSDNVSVISFAPDSDGDGISDQEEIDAGTNPNNADSDGDGVADDEDAFPMDATEWGDADGDGIGNNADLDDDNDGLEDTEEAIVGTNPRDPDTDGDFVLDSVEVECGADPLIAVDFPTATIQGTVTGDGAGLVGVLVKLLDGSDPTVVLDETETLAGGVYSFDEQITTTYEVLVLEPTGFRALTGTDNPVQVTPTCGTNTVDVELEAFVLVNNAKRRGYWKHQFDLHRKGKGHRASETEADLEAYIGSVKDRFTDKYYQSLFADEVDGQGDDIAEWHALLSARVQLRHGSDWVFWHWWFGRRAVEKKLAQAEAEIGALVLNVMSLKVGQTEIVSADGHDVGDVITYASQIVVDYESVVPNLSERAAYDLAAYLARRVNKQRTIPAGKMADCLSGLFDCERLYKGRQAQLPEDYTIEQNYPNPFVGTTTIRFGLPETEFVTVRVYDMLGKHVRTLVEGDREAGFHDVTFNGAGLASGTYFYRIQMGEFMQIRKLTIVR